MALFPARSYPLVMSSPLGLAWRRALVVCLMAFGVLYASATVARVVARKYYLFLPGYVRWMATPAPATTGPTHLLVLVTDHFEPNRQVSIARGWMNRYVSVVSGHRDATGRPPQHTWFYPAEQFEPEILRMLAGAVSDGYGEVEFHFHHDYDTAEWLKPRLQSALDEFATFGFNKTIDGQTRFAFVHGNFGLDNSNGPFYCGVSEELALLRSLGAFADFTFPSVYMDSQPSVVNQIFAARDDERPKSYDLPLPLSALRHGEADLMIFEGPLVFAPSLNARRLFLDLDDGDLHAGMPPSAERVRRWVRANVHVPQRPEWVFIKLFAHGVQTPGDTAATTGAGFDEMLTELETHYNDGRRYVLHYVTAREAYNVAMAAVDGHEGDPTAYFDYLVRPYVAHAGAAVPARE